LKCSSISALAKWNDRIGMEKIRVLDLASQTEVITVLSARNSKTGVWETNRTRCSRPVYTGAARPGAGSSAVARSRQDRRFIMVSVSGFGFGFEVGHCAEDTRVASTGRWPRSINLMGPASF
jgi:hypothetical protein